MMKLSILLLSAVLLFGGTACTKKTQTVYVAPDSLHTGRIQYILQYNPGQDSLFYNLLVHYGLADTLSGPGPFTVFALNNTALYNVYGLSPANYIAGGAYQLSSFPLGQTQVITTAGGYKIFVTGYDNGGDTVYTANGSVLQAYDQKATNGFVQVLERTMWYPYYPSIMSYINNYQDASVFAYAIQRSGLTALLSDSTNAYTVLLPGNTAYGALSLDSVTHMDSTDLVALVKRHIIPGRYFIYDFVHQSRQPAGTYDTLDVITLGGDHIQALVNTLSLSAYNYYPLEFAVAGNPQSAVVQWYNPFDVVAGAGVVQVIDEVLQP